MGDGLSPAAPTPPPTGSPGAAVQGSTSAKGATNVAGRGKDAPTREDGGDSTAGAFDLLLTGQPAATPPSASADASPDTWEKHPVADAASAPDQLLLLLAQVAPGATSAAPPTPQASTTKAPATTAAAEPACGSMQLPLAGDAPSQPPAAAIAQKDSPDSRALPDALGRMSGTHAGTTAAQSTAVDTTAVASTAMASTAIASAAIAEAAPTAPSPIDTAMASPAVMHAAQGSAANAISAPPAPAAPGMAPLPHPADPTAGYDDSFGTQITWLAEQRIGEAQIRISPEHLGAIDIRLQLDGDQVRAEFQSAHPEVRQTLEASLPRLRELLGQHGLQLAHAGVGQGRKQPDGMTFAQPTGTASRDEGDALPPAAFRRARGLLDVYA